MDGLLPSPEHLPSDAAFLDTRSRHATVRVWKPNPHVVEQAPKFPRFHSYVMHADVEHADVRVGFLAASHVEASALAPLGVLQSTVRVLVPVEPQVDTEQALHDEECHAGPVQRRPRP